MADDLDFFNINMNNHTENLGQEIILLRRLCAQTQEEFGANTLLHKNQVCMIEQLSTASQLTLDQSLKLFYGISRIMENSGQLDPILKHHSNILYLKIRDDLQTRITERKKKTALSRQKKNIKNTENKNGLKKPSQK